MDSSQMKVWVDATPSGPAARLKIVNASRALGIRTCSSHEAGVTHFVTAYPNAYKASLVRQSGGRVISFSEYGRILQQKALEPAPRPSVQHRTPNVRDNPVVAQASMMRRQEQSVQPVATPVPVERTADPNLIGNAPRAIDLD